MYAQNPSLSDVAGIQEEPQVTPEAAGKPAVPSVNIFDMAYGMEAKRYAESVNPTLREFANIPDEKLVERRQHYLDELMASRSKEIAENKPVADNPLSRLANAYLDSDEFKTKQAQNIFDRILANDQTITFDEWRKYDDHVGELRAERGGEMSLWNWMVGAKDYFVDAFKNGATGIEEVHKDGEYWKIATSLVEGGARDTRELFGSVWHSTNKDSWAYAVKQFLTGADTPEERYANFRAAQEFRAQTDRYLNGDEGLIFDPRYTNKGIVALGEVIGDPSFILGAFSGGSTAIASIAAKSARLAGSARAFHHMAKAATVAARATDYVTGLPLKVAGYPLWLAGAAVTKGAGMTINGVAKVASAITGSQLEGVKTAIKAAGLTGAGLGLDPFSRKFAAFYGLGLVAEGFGGAVVGAGKAMQRQGILTVAEKVAADTTLPNLSRKLAMGLKGLDNVIPIPSLTVDALRGGMVGASFNALLGAYSDGTRGAYHSSMAGFGGGAFGGIVGGVGARLVDPKGRRFIQMEFDYQMETLKKDDPAHFNNVMRFVDMHDKAGIETRHYILGVANRLVNTHKLVFMDGATFAANVDPTKAASAYEGVDAKGGRIIAINVDSKAMKDALTARAADPQGFEKGPFKMFRGGETTAVHEMFHGIMWNYGYKAGMINRLTHHLLGMQIEGQNVINTPVAPDVLDSFFRAYSLKLKAPEFYAKYKQDLQTYRDTGKINDGLRRGVEEFGAYFFEQWVKGKPLDYLFRGGDLGLARNAFQGIKELAGEAIRYGKRSMGIDLREAGYTFNEVVRRLANGEAVHTAQGFYDAEGNLVRDPVMDKIMEDMVKQTWNPPENTTIDTLTGEGLRTWAVSNGQERRIYQDRAGVWRFKDNAQFEKEEAERGARLFSTLEELKAAGVDIGAEIVTTATGKEVVGNLSIAALGELHKRGLLTAQETRYAAAINDAIVRGTEVRRKKGTRRSASGPNGLRFKYHGLSQEEVGPDGKVRRRKRPWQEVSVTDRHVFPYKLELTLTTKDKDGNKIQPTFITAMTGIDKDALDRRTINALRQKVRLKNGKVMTGSQLLGGYVGAVGKVRDYLRNLSKPNARPSELEFGGGPNGAAIRDLLYTIVGAVPTATTQFVNRPNASLPANERGPDHVFTTFRLDLMSLMEETKAQLTFNEDLAYRRTQENYQAEEEISYPKDNRPNYKTKAGKEVTKGKGKVIVQKQVTYDKAQNTNLFVTNNGVYVRSDLLLDDVHFKSNPVIDANTGEEMVDADGKTVKTVPLEEAQKLTDVLVELGEAIAGPFSGRTKVVPYNDKFVIVGRERGKNFLAIPETFDSKETADRVAEKLAESETEIARIRRKTTPVKVIQKVGKKETILPWNDSHKDTYIAAMRRVAAYNALYPDAIPVQLQMEDNSPVIIERVKGEDVEVDVPIVTQGYGLMEGSGLGSGRNMEDRNSEKYKASVRKSALALIDDFKKGIKDPRVKRAIDWYKANRRKIVALYGPNSNMFFELLAACSPQEGPQRNWEYAVEVMETFMSGKWDTDFAIAAQKRDQIFMDVESGAFRRRMQEENMVDLAKKSLSSTNAEITPEAIAAKVEIYKQKYEAAKQEAIALYIKKNSKGPKEVLANFVQEAVADKYDVDENFTTLFESILKREGLSSVVPTKKALIESAHEQLKEQVNWLANGGSYQAEAGKAKDPRGTLFRPSSNVKNVDKDGNPVIVQFGNHNVNIAEVLLGQFERLNTGPKIRNYGLNLMGGGVQATIDLWAARTLRRVIYESNGHKRYRILPMAEQPVSSGKKYVIERTNFDNKSAVDPVTGKPINMLTLYNDATGDFFLGQDIFEDASGLIRDFSGRDNLFSEAEKKALIEEFGAAEAQSVMGLLHKMEPHELQAVLWFREKILWAKNGWTSGTGGDLSSYEKGVAQMIGEEATAVDADNRLFSGVQRFNIMASVTVPTEEEYVGLGAVGDLNNVKASEAIKGRIRRFFGNNILTAVFGPTQGAFLADQKTKGGRWRGAEVYPEPSLAIDFTVKGNEDTAWLEALRVGRQLGLEGQQEAIIVNERVTSKHPNARDMYTVKFNTNYEYNSQVMENIKQRFATFSRIGGFTLEPALIRENNKTYVAGINFLHVPEFEVIYGVRGMKLTMETDTQVKERQRQFRIEVEQALKAFGWSATQVQNPDGSNNFVRIDKDAPAGEFAPSTALQSFKSKAQKEKLKSEALAEGIKVISVDHGFVNSVVMMHSEYASLDPVHLGRRGLTATQHVQRVKNKYEQAKETEKRIVASGVYESRTSGNLASSRSDTPVEAGRGQEGVLARGQEGSVRTSTRSDDGSLSKPEEADRYIAEAVKRKTDDRLGTIMEVGPQSDFIITRAKAKDGGYESGFRVTHKNDRFSTQFPNEEAALAYVRDRMIGKQAPPQNKDDRFDYYLNNVGIVSGVRRPAIRETGTPENKAAAERVGGIPSTHPMFGYNVSPTDVESLNDPSRGLFSGRVLVDPMDEQSRQLYQAVESLTPEQLDKMYFDAIAKVDTPEGRATAQKLVYAVARSKGYMGEYYHGSESPDDIREFDSRPDSGIAVYVSPNRRMAARFGSKVYRLAVRGDQDPNFPNEVVSKHFFDPTRPEDIRKLRKHLKDAKLFSDKWIDEALKGLKSQFFVEYERVYKNPIEYTDENGVRRSVQIPNLFPIQDGIAKLGYMGYVEREGQTTADFIDPYSGKKVSGKDRATNPRNLAIFDPSMVKSLGLITRDTNGNIVPLSRRFDESSPDINYQSEEMIMNPSQEVSERVYKRLAEKYVAGNADEGEIEILRGIVDSFAKDRGFHVGTTFYHGTRGPKFGKFNLSKRVHRAPRGNPSGAYSTNDSREAKGYAGDKGNVMEYYTIEEDGKKSFDWGIEDAARTDPVLIAEVEKAYRKYFPKNGIRSDNEYILAKVEDFKRTGIFKDGALTGEQQRQTLLAAGYEIGNDGPHFVDFTGGKYLKSRDIVTLDDNGKIVPLSVRFDKSVADSRYQAEETLVTTYHGNTMTASQRDSLLDRKFLGKQAELMMMEGRLPESFRSVVKNNRNLIDITIWDGPPENGNLVGNVDVTVYRDKGFAQLHGSFVEEKYRGNGYGNLLYSELANQLQAINVEYLTGGIADELGRPIKIRNKVFGKDSTKVSDLDGLIWATTKIDPNGRYSAEESTEPLRLSGVMKEVDFKPKVPNIDPKSHAFKREFIGLYAEQNPDLVASLLLTFGKLSSPRYNYIGRGGTAKASKDTHVVELTSHTNKVGYLRFDIVPDRAKKGRKVMNNVVVDINDAYRGNKFQHVLYSEAIERARILGATSFNQIIENEQGLPYRSQARILGEGKSALADMYTLKSYPATEEGWQQAKYPDIQVYIQNKDGTEEVKNMGKGHNKYVLGYGDIDPNRRYSADESPFDRYL